MNEDSKTTGMSEFAKDLYESARVIEPERETMPHAHNLLRPIS